MWQSLRECPTQLQNTSEKQKALRMVLMCAAVFFICFTPYHISFPFFMMVIENIIQDCAVHRIMLRFHPISLCLASLNCCLDPVLYYFMTSEFQDQLLHHSCAALRARFLRRGSSLSVTETSNDIRMKRRNLPRFKIWSLSKFFGRINSMEIPPMPPDELLLESIS
ncbi:putative P2Y purinoceptor 10 [Egretta garzetta]|nr:putative P2Y purinoceptor 10 [Egretta garzetta]